MTLLGSQDTGLGNVDTAGQPPGGEGGIQEIESTDGSVTVTNPTGPVVDLTNAGGTAPGSAITGLTFPEVAGVPTLTANAGGLPVIIPGELAVTQDFFAEEDAQVTGNTVLEGNLTLDGTEALNASPPAAPPGIASASSAGTSTRAARSDHTHGGGQADWPIADVGFFAVDGVAGNDANAGFSTVSQAAAGAVAVKTLARLSQIVPKAGAGRMLQVAVANANYASDTTWDLSQLSGYLYAAVYCTGTVPTAGAVEFTGDVNDLTACGMVTATGMNAAGYNPTAYSVAADGTPTITLQLAGGGAPGFGAMPARPYRCRLRFDHTTTTAALRNTCFMALAIPSSNSIVINLPLAANPVTSDVLYIEMPGMSGPTETLLYNTTGNAIYLVGLNFGRIDATNLGANFAGCEASSVVLSNQSSSISIGETTFIPGGFVSANVGTGLATQSLSLAGGNISLHAWCNQTGSVTMTGIESLLMERSATGCQPNVYGGPQAVANNIIMQIGTGTSTNHGAACQFWGTTAAQIGTKRCGLYLNAGVNLGRINFTAGGTGALTVPLIALGGSALGVTVGPIMGSTSDVTLDLSANSLVGDEIGAAGCTVYIRTVSPPTATGTAGDVRLAGGQTLTWGELTTTGITDSLGNRIIGNTTPLQVVGKFSGQILNPESGAAFTYLADISTESIIPTSNQVDPIGYETSQRLITRLRAAAPNGTGSQNATVTLYKNGAATAMTVTLPSGSGVRVAEVDLAHPILFADGDYYDVRVDLPAPNGGNLLVSATLEGP